MMQKERWTPQTQRVSSLQIVQAVRMDTQPIRIEPKGSSFLASGALAYR